MRRRGESGKNGHIIQTSAVKTIQRSQRCKRSNYRCSTRAREGNGFMEDDNSQAWNANGNRQATLPGAKENPNVSQFEMQKPVMQLAI